jgi:hypothetical protein
MISMISGASAIKQRALCFHNRCQKDFFTVGTAAVFDRFAMFALLSILCYTCLTQYKLSCIFDIFIVLYKP